MDNKSTTLKQLAAGLLFIVGLVLIVVSVFIIGIEKGLTIPKFQTTVLFHEVGGLVVGAPIRISGVEVGIVGDIAFVDPPIQGRLLKVRLDIFNKYASEFHKCSKVSIRTEGVLGQKFIEISQDHTLKSFGLAAAPLTGQDPLDVEDMAAVITKTAVSMQTTTAGAQEVLNQLKYISIKSKKMLNRIDEKLVEGNLFKIF